MQSQHQTIQLDDSLLIGKGRDRACYMHPDNPNLCIKVALQEEKQSKREKDYLAFLHKKNRDLSHVSQFKGFIQTNFGAGYIFELARDSNGEIALTLKEAIKSKKIKETEIMRLISKIEQYLSSQKICVYDLSPSNIVIYKDSSDKWQFFLIDGLGVATPNPLIQRTNLLTNNLLKRSFAQLKRKAEKTIRFTKLNTTPPKKTRKSRFQKNMKSIGVAISIGFSFFLLFYFELIEL